MRTVVDIYEAYRIPPWLQLHQLRVAAVGKAVAERISRVDTNSVILACLFHDMGNILKFDLSPTAALAGIFPDDQREYWVSVKEQYRATYGASEHDATAAIVKEIGLSDEVQAYIRGMGFGKAAAILSGSPVELLIIEYADQRVGPMGVLLLEERLADGNRRYAGKYGQENDGERARYQENIAALNSIEEKLMQAAQMRPEDLNDTTLAAAIEELKKFEIS